MSNRSISSLIVSLLSAPCASPIDATFVVPYYFFLPGLTFLFFKKNLWPSANLWCHLKTSALLTKCSLFVCSIIFSVWVVVFPRSWQNLIITRISSRSDDDILTLVALVQPCNECCYFKNATLKRLRILTLRPLHINL